MTTITYVSKKPRECCASAFGHINNRGEKIKALKKIRGRYRITVELKKEFCSCGTKLNLYFENDGSELLHCPSCKVCV